jgi:hypothetical protein
MSEHATPYSADQPAAAPQGPRLGAAQDRFWADFNDATEG